MSSHVIALFVPVMNKNYPSMEHRTRIKAEQKFGQCFVISWIPLNGLIANNSWGVCFWLHPSCTGFPYSYSFLLLTGISFKLCNNFPLLKTRATPSIGDNSIYGQKVWRLYATLPSLCFFPYSRCWWLVNATLNLSLFSPHPFLLLLFLGLNGCVKYCALWWGRWVSQHH